MNDILTGEMRSALMSVVDAYDQRYSPTELYRYYDSDGRLLYVGISVHAMMRATQHRISGNGWWDQAVTIKIERFDTRVWAEASEQLAIAEEHPQYNIIGVRRSRESIWALRAVIVGELSLWLECLAAECRLRDETPTPELIRALESIHANVSAILDRASTPSPRTSMPDPFDTD